MAGPYPKFSNAFLLRSSIESCFGPAAASGTRHYLDRSHQTMHFGLQYGSDRPSTSASTRSCSTASATDRRESPHRLLERAEGRDQPGRSPSERGQVRTQSRVDLPPKPARVNAAARTAVQTRFTALLHHVDVEALERAFRRQKRQASAGVDGVTVAEYEQNLEANLQNLCARVHTGRYRPKPVRRVYIPKADGGRRPLGVPTLEDKIVQGAVAETLSAIYEADFLGFSYGFRPGRNPHRALDALQTALMTERINWVLDADIRSFFDHACRYPLQQSAGLVNWRFWISPA